MARRLVLFLFIATLAVAGASLAPLRNTALAAGLDRKGKADAKEATRLYKQGRYEEAAQIYIKLSVDYPDMEIFDRNVGACYYYLRKPEPALSNLRRYLGRVKDIAPDDKAVVDRWIDEMEKLREQNAAASTPPAPPPPPGEPAPPVPTAAEAPGATTPPQPSPAPQTKANAPAQAGPGVASAASATAPGEAANKPAGIDLTASPAATDSTAVGTPFYKTWWFWTGAAAIVVAGTVTAILIAGRSRGACDGASLACMGVK